MDARKHGDCEEAKRGQKRKSDKRDTHRGTSMAAVREQGGLTSRVFNSPEVSS
jgi:hypothetical protein